MLEANAPAPTTTGTITIAPSLKRRVARGVAAWRAERRKGRGAALHLAKKKRRSAVAKQKEVQLA